MPDWSLLVSSDLAHSGPVLLYAAQKGAPMTPRMLGMLADVRRRALALAGCFHTACRIIGLSSAPARTHGSVMIGTCEGKLRMLQPVPNAPAHMVGSGVIGEGEGKLRMLEPMPVVVSMCLAFEKEAASPLMEVMARVPLDVVIRIATLARLSIVDRELVP